MNCSKIQKMKQKKQIVFRASIYLIVTLLTGCASIQKTVSRQIDGSLDSPFFDQHFTGILVVDAQTKDTLYKRNATKYFTPASNTKIFTLYASLRLLPEKIPALKYMERNDTLYIEGTGDPTLLHSHFQERTVLDFLSDKNNIALYPDNFQDDKLGPGWSWDDYHYYYQPERSSLPLYGNVLTLFNLPNKRSTPSYFQNSIVDLHYPINREAERNVFYFSSQRTDTVEIPFRTDTLLTKKFLEEVLDKKISLVNRIPIGEKKVIYGATTDSVLKRMMHESDNFWQNNC